jgi:16S rRNA (uracil1498-N3)-methyltransferase
MARRRFFVDEIRNGAAEIAGEDAKHLTRVLRVEPGQRYEISDNRSVWLAEIELARKERVSFRVLERIPERPSPVHVNLLAALVKFDHFEWMIEKATELGVETIVPVVAERSERGLDRAAGKRKDRWLRIALESSQQSRRDRLPGIETPVPLDSALERAAGNRFALDERDSNPPLLCVVPPVRNPTDTVALLVGPEGGWTDGERARFLAAGWTAVSLGPRILRAETAAVAGLAIISAVWQAGPPG